MDTLTKSFARLTFFEELCTQSADQSIQHIYSNLPLFILISDGTSSSSSSGKDQLPTPKRVLYPRENVQIGWKATGRKWNTGAGMVNVGNTCYLNSTLQALFHVPAIANWLISDSAHREQCSDNINGE